MPFHLPIQSFILIYSFAPLKHIIEFKMVLKHKLLIHRAATGSSSCVVYGIPPKNSPSQQSHLVGTLLYGLLMWH